MLVVQIKSESLALAHTSTIGLLKPMLSFAKIENSIAVLKTHLKRNALTFSWEY